MKIEDCKVGDEVMALGAIHTITAVGKKCAIGQDEQGLEWLWDPHHLTPVPKFQVGDIVKFGDYDRDWEVLYVGQRRLFAQDNDGGETSGYISDAILISRKEK